HCLRPDPPHLPHPPHPPPTYPLSLHDALPISRLMKTASTPSSGGSVFGTTSTEGGRAAFSGVRLTARTWAPASTSIWVSGRPTCPVAPVTKIMVSLPFLVGSSHRQRGPLFPHAAVVVRRPRAGKGGSACGKKALCVGETGLFELHDRVSGHGPDVAPVPLQGVAVGLSAGAAGAGERVDGRGQHFQGEGGVSPAPLHEFGGEPACVCGFGDPVQKETCRVDLSRGAGVGDLVRLV